MINKKKTKVKIFEAFAGIGSQYKALKNIADKKNWIIKSVGIVEWYLDAIIAYQLIHYSKPKNYNKKLDYFAISTNSKLLITNSNFLKIIKKKPHIKDYLISSQKISNNSFDITKINWKNIPNNIDIFTYSFPCQDLSSQGLQKGMKLNSGTKSSLLWEIYRLLSKLKDNKSLKALPKYLLLENVKNIINPKHIKIFNLWLELLKKLGYVSKYYLLNAKNFGVPQNRERVFCISVRKDFQEKINFVFPETITSIKEPIKELNIILYPNDDSTKYLHNLTKYKRTETKKTKNGIEKFSLLDYSSFSSENAIYLPTGIGPTLTASGANSRIKILKDDKIRCLSIKECFEYMGFTNEDYIAVTSQNIISNNGIMFVLGNSIVVPILESIFSLFKF